MILPISDKYFARGYFISLLILLISFSGCTVIRKYQKNKPFVYKNIINLNIDKVTSDEKVIIRSRLNTQLDDSAKVRTKDVVFVLHYVDSPPVFDTLAAKRSAENMQLSMINLGYYNAMVHYKYAADSVKDQVRITTTYDVIAGKPTLIDTFAYHLSNPDLQQLAISTKDKSPLQKNAPVTKAAVSGESDRLITLFRNNGFYGFTSDDLRVTGDTSIEALTTVSDDPFETVRLLQEANERRNKPTIKLAMQLNNADTTEFKKYYINNIYILPDFIPGDNYTDPRLKQALTKDYIIRYHNNLFRQNVILRNIFLKKGDLYKEDDYYKTLNSLYKVGVWESPNIDIIQRKDTNLLDMIVKLIPVKKYGFEGNIELSYSANSNTTNNISATNAGNLLGVSANLSLLNRNVGKQAIQMTNSIRAGVEFNTSRNSNNGSLINSNELSYTNNVLIPKFVTPFKSINKIRLLTQQTFINTNVSQINRIDFFNQQIFNIGYGYNWTKKINHSWTYRPLNIDYRRLYNRSASFDATLEQYPFLRYSFNTALVMGSSLSYALNHVNQKHPLRQSSLKFNLEESGLLWGRLKKVLSKDPQDNFLGKYLKEFVKTDVEYTYTISHPKSAIVLHSFAGVGIPLSRTDTTLPFFKQYFEGGPNSMRGWPVRGIGVGGQPLAPFDSLRRFNDRTGDIQLEGNIEYRYNIVPLFSNTIQLKGALFVDAGNIWNFKNTKTDGSRDSAQFRFADLYKQLGVSAGTGFRLDFSYFLIRFDLGFRFKRPDVAANNGWQFPAINFKNLFGKGTANKRWRYENFNFTIGINYPF
ncbi:MAG: BamA/TamA family outer membrane protein [Chitinophagaceae bacterium]|nr:BamA/TamA family outer membrane protein [Chitinophagaceae bacterium]